MIISCDSCKGSWNASDKMGTKRNCPHCGKAGKVMSVCSKCGKTMIADTTFDEHSNQKMANPFAAATAIKCPKCNFLGHWTDFKLVLDSSRTLFGFKY